MKINTRGLVTCIAAIAIMGVALVLAQLWFDVFSPDIFWKLVVTLLALGGLASFLAAIKQDLSGEKKLRDDKYLD